MAKEVVPPASTQPPSQAPSQPARLEDHFQILEEAVAALETDDLPLEDAIKRYETGLAAVRNAGVLLDQYRARLEELRTDAS